MWNEVATRTAPGVQETAIKIKDAALQEGDAGTDTHTSGTTPGRAARGARPHGACASGLRRLPALLAVVALYLTVAPATAASLLVVARGDSPAGPMTRSEAADLFLDRGSPPAGLKPIDRRDPELREHFYRAVADMSAKSLRAYWAKRVFTGRGRPPPTLGGDEAARLLADDRSAITYVTSDQRPPGSKVLLIIELGEEK